MKTDLVLTKEDGSPLKIARISTIPFFVATQLKQQIVDISSAGANVTVISSYGDELDELIIENKIRHIDLHIQRRIDLVADIIALVKLFNLFRKNSFDIIHSTTPKAGLLTSIAGFFTSPIRIHTFTGQVWCNSSGVKQWVLRLCDKIIIFLNTRCYADSRSQVSFLVEQKVIKSADVVNVLGRGSIAGVDLKRFDRALWGPRKVEMLSRFGLNNGNYKVLFLGRLSREKGIVELIEAFIMLLKQLDNCDLLLVGPLDDNGGIPQNTLDTIDELDRIFHFEYTKLPESFFAVADVCCLPSYREGFGTVVVEAAAMGVPTVGTDVVGLVDSIVDGETGLLVPLNNVNALANALYNILINDSDRKKMGEKACSRVANNFSSEDMSNLLINSYIDVVNN